MMKTATPEKRRRRVARLRIAGGVLLLLGGASAAYGIVTRHAHLSSLASASDAEAVMTVAVVSPAPDLAPRALTLPGNVSAWYEAPIYARVSGYLQNWFQDIGAHVKANQTLALIDTPDLDQELAQAEADLATARANSALADLTAKRWRALLGTNAVSEQSVDEKQGNALAQHAVVNAQLAHVDRLRALESFKRLAAPFAGIVTARNTDIGALIEAGPGAHPLFRVADTHEMRIYVAVPQAYASELRPGLDATLAQPQYPGQHFAARLATTSGAASAESRTVLAELHAANPDGKLWPGTYAEVTFTLPGDSAALRVPADALIFRDKGAEVATVTPDNHIDFKPIVITRNLGTAIEVTSGLSQNDRVVVSPPDTIAQGDAVRIAGSGSTDASQAAE